MVAQHTRFLVSWIRVLAFLGFRQPRKSFLAFKISNSVEHDHLPPDARLYHVWLLNSTGQIHPSYSYLSPSSLASTTTTYSNEPHTTKAQWVSCGRRVLVADMLVCAGLFSVAGKFHLRTSNLSFYPPASSTSYQFLHLSQAYCPPQ